MATTPEFFRPTRRRGTCCQWRGSVHRRAGPQQEGVLSDCACAGISCDTPGSRDVFTQQRGGRSFQGANIADWQRNSSCDFWPPAG